MIVLKAQAFPSIERITKFINENTINREVILEITHGKDFGEMAVYTVFFYGDSDIEEKLPGFWG
ncbi:MAG: hypothetical protein JWQ34_1751 [Mucilaginibacter sp.]|uniref:hypothetical protein n=1 Tax=Mucilaginibacter sp. TaxID=1882438 RepID=UPI0026150AD9|nr:hypothetical protein [Mucilaginibacter sp.]MDB5003526.1 hypothetical protein [Mucilaginibacter sp.]